MTQRAGQPLRIGTRASNLARWQADWVAERVRKAGREVELVPIRTEGDVHQSGPIAAIGAQGVFTKRLQAALLEGQIDVAVHSMKDLPTGRVDGLALAATPPRDAVHDALASAGGRTLHELRPGAVVGTGSARRGSQLLAARSDLTIRGIRGNVETRLGKVDSGEYDAIVIAHAGLRRLGLEARATQVLPLDVMLPAPGQGALAVECRADDASTLAALEPLDHKPTRAAVTAERRALAWLEGGCLAAMGAHAQVVGERLTLAAVVLSEDGSRRLFEEASGDAAKPEELGERVAYKLLDDGAGDLLRPRP